MNNNTSNKKYSVEFTHKAINGETNPKTIGYYYKLGLQVQNDLKYKPLYKIDDLINKINEEFGNDVFIDNSEYEYKSSLKMMFKKILETLSGDEFSVAHSRWEINVYGIINFTLRQGLYDDIKMVLDPSYVGHVVEDEYKDIYKIDLYGKAIFDIELPYDESEYENSESNDSSYDRYEIDRYEKMLNHMNKIYEMSKVIVSDEEFY